MDYTKTIETHQGAVVIRKLKVGEYVEILRELKTIPAKIGEIIGMDNFNNQKLVELAPAIIDDFFPEICKIFAKSSDKDEQFYAACYPDELVDIFVELYLLNDFTKIGDSIKKITARKVTQ